MYALSVPDMFDLLATVDMIVRRRSNVSRATVADRRFNSCGTSQLTSSLRKWTNFDAWVQAGETDRRTADRSGVFIN